MTLRSCLAGVPREWKAPIVLFGLMALELAISVPALALFGIAEPDLYRTRFWKEGSDHGWNSNPNQLIYAYANYRPIKAPLPWRQLTTNWNVVIAVLSVFILLVKGIMFICAVFHPLFSLFIHSGLAAVWAVSVYLQAAPDMSDPEHPQPGAPWYITKSCGPPVREKLIGYCKQAKAAFAISVLMTTVFTVYLIFTLIALYPTKSFRASRRSNLSDDEKNQPWEMLEAPKTPRMAGGLMSPTTPRTKAFNTLTGNSKQPKQSKKAKQSEQSEEGNKGIQLRHHISMGNETYQGPSDSSGLTRFDFNVK